MDSNDPQIENTKRPYEKPVAKKFALRPEEAVLGFCKSASSGNGSSSPPGSCRNHGIFCQTAGS
jgi:hypothetical protein